MQEILMVAPLEDIYEKTKTIIREQGYDNVAVELGNLHHGVEKGRKGIAHGASILVSRGGTCKMLQETFPVPVVELKVTASDIIESLSQLDNTVPVVGVVGFKNVVDGFDVLKPLLQLEIIKIELHEEEDIFHAIEKYKNLGIKTFIGDANVLHVSSMLGCTGIAVTSSRDSILTVLEYARSLLTASKIEKFRVQQTIVATNFVHEAIVAVDGTGVISIFNKAAEQIFGIAAEDAVKHTLNDAVHAPKLIELLHCLESQTGQLIRFGDKHLVVNHAPVVVDGRHSGAVATIQNVTEMQNVEQKVRRQLAGKGFSARYSFQDIIGEGESVQNCIQKAREYARYDSPVLLTGESGVGKELFSQSIHTSSTRVQCPFVAINCAAIPASLIEAELFGYAEGSFTGAKVNGRAGIFELAHKGTVFLDEIGDLPLELQGRLLRVLQEKQIMRLGGDKMIPVDVRVLCATNRNLLQMMEGGTFRQDLFFRINVLTLHVPSLSERGPANILALAEHFLRNFSLKYGKPKLTITPEVERLLLTRKYPGNIRELESLMERCEILSSFSDLKETSTFGAPVGLWETGLAPIDLRTMENRYIMRIYRESGGNRKKTCEILGINRTTLWRRLQEAGISDA